MAKFVDIEKYLKDLGLNFTVIDLPTPAVTVEDVIKASGGRAKREEMVKTLIVKLKNKEFVGLVLRGDDRLDFEKANVYRLATKDEVMQIAQVTIGAVCPILLGIPVIVDPKVTQLENVNLGSGDLLKGMEMHSKDLLAAIKDHRIEEIT